MSERTYLCTFRCGKIVEGLTFDESYALFLEVQKSDNPCVVTVNHEEYRVPE